MNKIEEYKEILSKLSDWEPYLIAESGLPGPRGNIELAQAVALLGTEEYFLDLLNTPEKAPANTPEEFLNFCGTLGIGELLKQGKKEYLETLRTLASDTRWRTREAVAMALQNYGGEHFENLINEMEKWAEGNNYEKRAAAAALCEPKLLKEEKYASAVLGLLNRITESICESQNRKEDSYIALKKGMAYCWSVAAAGNPTEGKQWIEKWAVHPDKDIHWIIKENLKKKRLERMDRIWAEQMKKKYGE